ncbi:GcrA family cell cycle regulator [Bradyrhizobium commune]|uniref:GcrA-like regulator n=1 Tax=Bradyrhizobium commune TaxID=83627 RepID=A0A7S9H2F5_9BRAD|nr:GcrA family cell cycle regulator [Bradyrhizobium commune]QPF94724.1 GcrA-like regulator [Bradyrhizobium commune]
MPVFSPTSSPTWTDERIERLKRHFEAGLSCREIAADIGVSRNAVIGKLSRLNLTRGRSVDERKLQDNRSFAPPRAPKTVPRLQYEMLATIYGETAAPVVTGPIDDTNRCSLLELSENRCRWPISTPGADDFCFCGNASHDGQPYCAGHSRLAYRPNSRVRIARG